MKDVMGDRMKDYENTSKYFLPKKSYVILRLDGKSFHTYTRKRNKPFDYTLMSNMFNSALEVSKHIQGFKMLYTQSDEVSILFTDTDSVETEAWFRNNISKMTSISASIMTAHFNKLDSVENKSGNMAYFDSRVFVVPRDDIANYFLWRVKDCSRNSLNMLARSEFSHKELDKKSQKDVHEMLHAKGINFTKYPAHVKNGNFFIKNFGEYALDSAPTFNLLDNLVEKALERNEKE